MRLQFHWTFWSKSHLIYNTATEWKKKMIWIKIKAKHPNAEMFPKSDKRNNESLNRGSGKGEGGTEELRRYLGNGPHEMHKKNLG